MADDKIKQAGRQEFAKAFESAVHGGAAPRKKGYMVAVAVAVVVFAGGAVGVGAAVSHKSSAAVKTAQAATFGRGTPLRSATPASSGKAVARAQPPKGAAVRRDASVPGYSPGNVPGYLPSNVPVAQQGGHVAAEAPVAPHSAAAPQSAAPAPRKTAVTSFFITGQVSCVSGNSVEGVWVQAAKGSGFAPWQGLGNGSTSDWWFTLPRSEPYALHVGCGGTTASWKVATYSPTVSGGHNSFNCFDVAGAAGYGTCRLR